MKHLKNLLLLVIVICLIAIVGVSNIATAIGYLFIGTCILIIVLGAIAWVLDTFIL